MTRLYYRLDDDITGVYQEYLDKKDSCKIAYTFYAEYDDRPVPKEEPTKYEQVKMYERIPFFH